MTKRAKLSLDPEQRGKPPPAHGFAGQGAEAAANSEPATEASPARGKDRAAPSAAPGPASPGAAAASEPAPIQQRPNWQAHRPQADATESTGASHNTAAGAGTAPALGEQLAAAARNPKLRGVAAALAAGLALYLLRRRLF